MNKHKQTKSTSSKTIVVLKRVGRSSDNSGRIYLPGSWIGKTVRVTLIEKNRTGINFH
jgi:putative transposon-encoded protein